MNIKKLKDAIRMSPKIVGIYRIQNKVNGKVYIGQSWDIYNRWKRHIYISVNRKKKGSHKLYNALSKYGREGFTWDIIIELNTQDKLDVYEKFWIKVYDSTKHGYNIQEGGKGGKHTDETKKKIGISSKGRIFSDETKKKMSQSQRNVSDETKEKRRRSNTGKKHTDETKKKISISSKGRIASDETKKKISVGNKGKSKSKEAVIKKT